MKKEVLLFASIAAAMVLLIAPAAGGFERDDVLYRIRYDLMAERDFEGTVLDKPRVFDGFMYFTLRTNEALVVVQVGPKDFVQRSKLKLDAGQKVAVVGMPVVFDDRQVVLAREVTKDGVVFVLRDRKGEPLWEMDRPIQMDPKFGDDLEPIC